MLRKLKRISENQSTLSSERPSIASRLPFSSSITGLLVLAAERMISTTALPHEGADSSAVTPKNSDPASPALITESTAVSPLADAENPTATIDTLGGDGEGTQLNQTEPSRWKGLGIGAFLVSGPVFLEAPLVREFPVTALVMTLGWLGLAAWCDRQPRWKYWGDILFGFSLSWFAGAIYWGWFRWEPALHLPLESIGVPIAIACLFLGRGRLGSWFYLGSLLGTAVTDAYLWAVDLIPYWERVMQVEPTAIAPILADALAQMNTLPGLLWAIVCASALLISGGLALRSRQVFAWIFAGAVLNTLAVDGLFWLTAMLGKM